MARRYENIQKRLKKVWWCCRCQRKKTWTLREKYDVRRRKRFLAFTWFYDLTVSPNTNSISIDSRTCSNVVSYKLMCENYILTLSYLEYFVVRHQSENLLYSITLQMNFGTFYPKWDLWKHTLLHNSDNSKERMRSRTLVMFPIITVFSSLCYFMNDLATIPILRKMHRSILLKNCTFQDFSDFDCEFTEFIVLSFLSNYCLYPPNYLTLSLYIYVYMHFIYIYIYMCM